MDWYVVKDPDRLPIKFGREAEHNMFHGGTIFHDSCSKYIFIENRVSLGAGEKSQLKTN